MRLINTSTLDQKEFLGTHDLPDYAILSHRWGRPEQEVSFREFQDRTHRQDSYGWRKIVECCHLAKADALDWAWVDTCCIDKSSSAELTEAINSMFQWYKKAKICYAFLPDVSPEPMLSPATPESSDSPVPSTFRNSKWFSRGWTLQELLAPRLVVFFNRAFQKIGTRHSLKQIITKITGIDTCYLLEYGSDLRTASIATRMSWASNRQTSRVEDIAYCLLGIFDVNMPLLYGEGERAFMRLQSVIIQNSQDSSIFAWGFKLGGDGGLTGVLADSPRYFNSSRDIFEDELHLHQSEGTFEITSRGIEYWLKPLTYGARNVFSIKLRCKVATSNEHIILRTVRIGRTWYRFGLQKRRLTVFDRAADLFYAIVVPSHSIHMATNKSMLVRHEQYPSDLHLANRYTVVTMLLGVTLSSGAFAMWLHGGSESQFVAINLLLFALEIVPLTSRAILPLAWSVSAILIWWRS